MKIEKMNLLEKLHQPGEVQYIKSLDLNGFTSFPRVVEIDTTEICNLACPGCISEEIIYENNSFSEDRLIRLGEELYAADVKAVVLIGGGEPLCHYAVGTFMTYLGEHGIQIGITTNGTLIDKYLDIIAEYASWTRVSMDSATDEMFGILRPSKNGTSQFHKVIDNMKALAKIKKGKLGYSFLIRTEADGPSLRSNVNEIYLAAKLAKEIGCDYIEFKPSYMYLNNNNHYLIKHSPDEMQRAKEELEKCQELADGTFKIIKAVTLDYSLQGEQDFQQKDYHSCPVASMRTLICPSGVYVCPYFRGKSDMCIGNVKLNSFQEMWHGEQRKEVLNHLDPAIHCKMHCIRHQTNVEVFDMLQNNDFKIIKELGDRFI